jgi:hypothetical protein
MRPRLRSSRRIRTICSRAMNKTCFKCRLSLPRSEFYAHKEMGDGLLGKCKACTKSDVAEYRATHADKVAKLKRAYEKSPKRMKAVREFTRAWRAADPRRMRAHNAAIRTHKEPVECCQMCGRVGRLERHHPDYDLPKLVTWLCKPCHAVADRLRRQRQEVAS